MLFRSPELKDVYFNKYIEARRQAGLSTDKIDAGNNFIKYMVEDLQYLPLIILASAFATVLLLRVLHARIA